LTVGGWENTKGSGEGIFVEHKEDFVGRKRWHGKINFKGKRKALKGKNFEGKSIKVITMLGGYGGCGQSVSGGGKVTGKS